MDDQFVDPIYICLYCGDIMNRPNDRMMELFGEKALVCCSLPMIKADRDKIYTIVLAIDKLKENLEGQILSGVM